MKIGFDAKRAFLNGSGLGNYSRNLLNSLAQSHKEHTYHLYTPRMGDLFPEALAQEAVFQTHGPLGWMRHFSALWRSRGITQQLIKDEIDLFHGLSNELPTNLGIYIGKKVITVHDLIFLRYPELYPGIDRALYYAKVSQGCSDADVVVAISQQTKNDLIKFMNIPSSKIQVVYQSCDATFFNLCNTEASDSVKTKHALPSEYLLYVGTIEDRKNLLLIIEALAQVKNIPLVVVGKKKPYFEKVQKRIIELGLVNRVRFLDTVSNSDLPALYQHAKAFLYPSFFEGFGIPIIEALASKTPVITTAGGVFPEAGGPHSLYINPNRADELASAISLVLNNKDLRESMMLGGWEFVHQFTPANTALKMALLYEGIK